MANIKISEQKVLQIEAICKDFNNEKGELINVLHKTPSDTYQQKFRK